MKKTLVAVAAIALFSQAHAQSSVTLFGIIDTGVSYGSGSVSNRTQLSNSGLATSQIGFRGVEDLGGGLKAGFWLEAQLATDSGAGTATNTNNQTTGTPAAPGLAGGQGLTFNRRSTVSLSSEWGQVILGRDYHPLFWNNAVFDPFGVNGVGTSQAFLSQVSGAGPTPTSGPYMGAANPLSSRASNSVAYAYGYAPNGQTAIGTGGFYAHVMYFMGENNSGAATSSDGKGHGMRLGYNGGAFNTALGYLSSRYLGPAGVPAAGAVVTGDVRSVNFGGSYDFGVAKASAMLARDTFGPRTGRGSLVGVSVPLGAGVIRAAHSTYRTDATNTPRSSKLALGYVYNLSKRTALYTTVARVRNSGGAAQAVNGAVTAANGSSSGYDIGIKHSF